MADALVSPAVGGTMWAVTAGGIAYCSRQVRRELDDQKTPLMGVLGAFLFAVQMINFSIPGTGSSGHLGGGLLLAILLGPHGAFLTIASVLVVQALFFADGGLLALGCNIVNLGFFPAFIAYPLFYRKLAGGHPGQTRLTVAAVVAAVVGLQLGACAVVLETVFSGVSSLPLATFLLLMQPIHLAIGLVEGFVTATVVAFVCKARPEIVRGAMAGARPLRGVILAFLVAAILAGGVVSRFASQDPDGLEWSVARVTGKEKLPGSVQGLHGALASLQARIALLPDYAFKNSITAGNAEARPGGEKRSQESAGLGTSFSGVVGGLITLALVCLLGFLLKKRSRAS